MQQIHRPRRRTAELISQAGRPPAPWPETFPGPRSPAASLMNAGPAVGVKRPSLTPTRTGEDSTIDGNDQASVLGALDNQAPGMSVSEPYAGRQIVGFDLHRRRSVLVRMTEAGERLETVRISNDPEYLREVMTRAGEAPEVVLEACYGWYWAADTLAELGATVHLAHPLGVKMFSYRRLKNDERDAADLADLLRMGRLPRGLDRPTGHPGTARLGTTPGQAGRAAVEPEMPGPRHPRQRRNHRADE